MTAWPPIADAKLRRRLSLSEPDFDGFVRDLAQRIGPRPFQPPDYERALRYPWRRPAESFLIRDGDVTVIGDSARDDLLARALTGMATDGSPVYPLLAFGSNAAPAVLRQKLEQLPAGQREALVVAGELCEYDVVASPHFALYGAMPATITSSDGTSARAALIWLTADQLAVLTWTEINYALVRLPAGSFRSDLPAHGAEHIYAYVSRNGEFLIGGEPVALAAVPAGDRRFAALEQEQVLAAAAILLGAEGPADLVERVVRDYTWAAGEARPKLMAVSRPFDPAAWDAYGSAVDEEVA